MTARRPLVEPALLSVAETAVYLGLSRRTVERLSAERGEGKDALPVVQITPGRRHFRRVDLDAYIARHVVRRTA